MSLSFRLLNLGSRAMAGLAPAMAAAALIAGPARAAELPEVICLTEWGPQPTGAYRTRPHACDLHERGEFPVAHVNVQVTKRLHWLHWTPTVAVAHGKLGISTYGLAPLKLRLMRPLTRCGHTVFTQARFTVTIRFDGEKRTSRFQMPLDNCLR